jgi:hypothetical protein
MSDPALVQRLRFVRGATIVGWRWLVEVTNHLGAIVLLLLAIGVSTVSAVKLPDWWLSLPIAFGFYALLFGEGAFRLWRDAAAASDKTWPGVYLASHQLTVLRSELQHLHQLFLDARGATNEPDLTWIKVADYQRGTEPRIRNELAIHGDLLTLYHDDTLEPQPSPGDDARSELVKFLQRRHARLREVIDAYERRYGMGASRP